jgi:hypothetical protein
MVGGYKTAPTQTALVLAGFEIVNSDLLADVVIECGMEDPWLVQPLSPALPSRSGILNALAAVSDLLRIRHEVRLPIIRGEDDYSSCMNLDTMPSDVLALSEMSAASVASAPIVINIDNHDQSVAGAPTVIDTDNHDDADYFPPIETLNITLANQEKDPELHFILQHLTGKFRLSSARSQLLSDRWVLELGRQLVS